MKKIKIIIIEENKNNIIEENKNNIIEENKDNLIEDNKEDEKTKAIQIKKDYFEFEKAQLNKLEEKINEAYEEHLKILNKPYNKEGNKNNKYIFTNEIKDINDLFIISKQRKISIISNVMNYNYEKNSKISSLISTKLNEEISTALDNLISLIRLLNSKKDNIPDNNDIKEERINLLKQSFGLLKKYTICPYNQKVLIEIGLLSFIENLNKKEECHIYSLALDVLKNCTYNETVVQILISSSYFDYFIEEVLNFYENSQIINENEIHKICFDYNNIILNNIIKSSQGFESLLNKIGFKKILLIGKDNENINLLNNIVINLNEKLQNPKQNQILNISELINDILDICKKVFEMNIEEIKDNLFIQTLKLVAIIYDKSDEDLSNHFDIIKIICSTFDLYKNNYEYISTVIYLLKTIFSKDKTYFNEIIKLNLINKITEDLENIESKDDLIYNFSDLLYNLLEININKENIYTKEVINHILNFINKFSKKLDNKNELSKDNEENINVNKKEKQSMGLDENTIKVYNSILNNYLKIISYLSLNEIKIDIINEYFLNAISNAINKQKLDIPNINICLVCINYYYIKTPKEDWENENIQNVFLTITRLKETYYTNIDILNNITQLVGNILQGLTLKFLIERFYSLVLDIINCQDSTEKLIVSILTILKDNLIKNEELQNEVFDNTEQVILNLLKLYPNNYLIILNSYEIINIFSVININAQVLVNSDLISLIRSTLLNKELILNTEQNNEMRLIIYKLVFSLINDKDINAKISLELMEYFIKDLKAEIFAEYLQEIISIIKTLFRNKLTIETFLQNSGLDALSYCLDKFYENKKFIFEIFTILRDIIFSSNENKEKVRDSDIKEKLEQVLDKLEDKDKKIKFEGKILVHNINYIKKEKKEEDKDKSNKLPYIDYIEKEKIIKNKLYNVITRGIPVKSINPKGKIKDFIFCFSPDLFKIYLKKQKCGTIPPKAKYTIETPLVKDVIYKYQITNKKGGLSNKPPEKQFAIEQELIEGQKEPKLLVIMCNNNIEAKSIWGCVEIIVDYVKKKCGKEYKFKIEDYKKFFEIIQFDEMVIKNFDRKRSSVIIKSNINIK